MNGLESGLGRLTSILWRIAGIAFAILLTALIVVLSQGEQAPNTTAGRVAAVVMFITMPVTAVAILALFFLQLRRIRLRLKSGERFSDVDPRRQD
jgi:succinate dehydrogenase/fumarate reductase cytochrome b subunit